MSKHTHNWEVRYATTLPSGTTSYGVVYARTRKDARRKVLDLHTDAPHGVLVRHGAPRKFNIV